MSTLNISLFGKFCVRRNGHEIEGLDARKVQELFCYLLLHRDHALSRETLASLLWPETTTALSKKNLRQALWQLQSALGAQNESLSERVLIVEPEWIRLNPEADLWLDAAALENAFQLVQKIPGQKLNRQQAQTMQNAIKLYQGPLLEGWYQEWCLQERELLQGMYLTLLDKLMGYCEAHYDYETGLLYGVRILYYDRARERTHQQLMKLHYLNGDRAAALRQFEDCSATLEEELNASPSKGTMELYEQILADEFNQHHTDMAPTEIPLEISESLLSGMLNHLVQLQESLSQLQTQVSQSIEVVEQAITSYSLLAQKQSAG